MQLVIIGYGKFGQLAAKRLREAFPAEKIIVVENDVFKLSAAHRSGNLHMLCGNGVEYLVETRDDLLNSESWIIPTVPLHLLANVALRLSADLRQTRLPQLLDALLPNTYRLDDSTLCCSYADFVCPDDCEEGPACTVTGEQRKPLYVVLQELDVPGIPMHILVSQQLSPGIGGYRAQDFFRCIDEIPKSSTIIGTSCRCHAILTAVMRGNKIEPDAILEEEPWKNSP